MALTKHHIVEQIQAQLGVLNNRSIDITEFLLELIKACLESGDDLLVSGFGKFCVKEKVSAEAGSRPLVRMQSCRKTGGTFEWPGKLRDKVNGNNERVAP